MKQLQWVTAIEPCFDAGGGGEIRQAHLIDALATRFDVHLLLAGRLRDERVRSRLASLVEVPALPNRDPSRGSLRRVRDIKWRIVDREADEVARNSPIRRALSPLLTAAPERDIVCVEYIGLASLLPRVRRNFWSLTLHNLTSEMARQNATIAPGRRQRLMQTLEARNARRLERWAVHEYDLVVAVSPDDAAMLPSGVVVVPNGVDMARFTPSQPPGSPHVVFTGALHTLPNRDGIRWFCSEVWPAIRSRLPTAELEIVGARPPTEITSLAEIDGVSVHADVPDVVPFLARARVAVIPLRIGTGSRLKALEAMAAGRAVVSTAIGAGGLQVERGRHLLVADEPQQFTDAVIRCLTDDELVKRLAAEGRAAIERQYSWKHIGAEYSAFLENRVASS